MFPKVAQIDAFDDAFQNSLKVTNFWATFENNFVTKNFQNLPTLVTLERYKR